MTDSCIFSLYLLPQFPIDQECMHLEDEKNNLLAYSRAYEKENKKLKTALALKESMIDDNLTRITGE